MVIPVQLLSVPVPAKHCQHAKLILVTFFGFLPIEVGMAMQKKQLKIATT